MLWACHRLPTDARPTPACEYPVILAAAAKMFPQCLMAPAVKRRPDVRAEVRALAMDTGTSAATLRLRLLMLTDEISAREAADVLKMSRSTYYAATANLGRGNR